MKADETFIRELLESQRAVFLIAEWINTKGFTIQIPPINVRPTFDRRNEFTDELDFVAMKDMKTFRCEVKRRGIDFESLEGFPYRIVIVEDYQKVLGSKTGLLEWYFLVSKDYSGFLFITKDRIREHQRITAKHDKTYNKKRQFIEVEKQHFEYRSLKELTKRFKAA